MNISDIKPSHFCDLPFSSVLQKNESETIAVNIMKIRRRLGGKWNLTWEEYKTERLKDSGFSEIEKPYFDEVYPMIADAFAAIAFSPSWARAIRQAAA